MSHLQTCRFCSEQTVGDHFPFIRYGTRHSAHADCFLADKGEQGLQSLTRNQLDNFPFFAATKAGLREAFERIYEEKSVPQVIKLTGRRMIEAGQVTKDGKPNW